MKGPVDSSGFPITQDQYDALIRAIRSYSDSQEKIIALLTDSKNYIVRLIDSGDCGDFDSNKDEMVTRIREAIRL